ncbi:FtsB family cell division protein, partial [Escherichia coli]|uniref:FtsB family cell division protein n=1 Tax=Escherichia coli TaxID=562 RepID=UPI001CCF23A2
EKEQQKVETLAKLEEVKEEQDLLKKQLVKLDDDDYIAKLSRKEYFLSDKNEIIFTVPENKKKKDEKDDGKE